MKYFIVLALLGFLSSPLYGQTDPTEEIRQNLISGDAEFWIHGAYDKQDLYVLTWRDQDSFFHHLEYPLYSRDIDLAELKLKRHDKVRVKGKLVERRGAPPHIKAESLEIISRYEGHAEQTSPREFSLGDLEDKDKAIFQVHTVAKNILVVEYQDMVLPMFVRKWTEQLSGLFRGDVVELSYSVFKRPNAPPHLFLDVKKPVIKLLNIQEIHEAPALMTGCLVRFPKSPQIRFDIFAVLNKNQWGYDQNFTIVNFTDFELFESMRQKLSDAWKAAPKESIVFKRNRFVNCGVQVEITGTYNLVSPNQANPQILVDSLADIRLVNYFL